MKTTIQTIEQAICNHYKGVRIRQYYVEDAYEVYQRIVIFGLCKCDDLETPLYFYGSIIGNKKNEASIMKDIEMYENRFEALYRFARSIQL